MESWLIECVNGLELVQSVLSNMSCVHCHPQLSLMGKIIPSPDWFVGVDSLDLCDGGQWVQEVSLDLYPYDAGTDSGFTFSSPNYLTVPQENITQVTADNILQV